MAEKKPKSQTLNLKAKKHLKKWPTLSDLALKRPIW